MKVGGKIFTSDQDIARTFLKYYRSVSNFNPEVHIGREINSPKVNQNIDYLFSLPFKDKEFQRSLQKLTWGKSTGPDHILPEFIMELGKKG